MLGRCVQDCGNISNLQDRRRAGPTPSMRIMRAKSEKASFVDMENLSNSMLWLR